MKELKSYHKAWLEDHPQRNEEWLREKLRDGFHIHHLDGNHSNDDPDNLVLMEGDDHFRKIHGRRLWMTTMLEKKIRKPKKPKRKRQRLRDQELSVAEMYEIYFAKEYAKIMRAQQKSRPVEGAA
jgi:hypothetical protein